MTKAGIVTVVGKPNAGKSTLLNRIVGQKLSITSEKPQSTRDRVVGIHTTATAQFIILDTPGLLDPAYALQQAMQHTAVAALKDADVIVYLADARAGIPPTLESAIGGTVPIRISAPVITVLNKTDLLSQVQHDQLVATISGDALPDALPSDGLSHNASLSDLRSHAAQPSDASSPDAQPTNAQPSDSPSRDTQPNDTQSHSVTDTLLISALTGDGIDALISAIETKLPASPFLYPEDEISTQSVRFFAAELIRETALEQLHEEVPYSLACEIEEFRESRSPIYIRAILYVERDSQKRIIIGEQGRKIREIGAAARQKIEKLVGEKIYLDLWVKVLQNWRKNAASLRRLGYDVPPHDNS